jgi:hypothetical protein
MPSSSYGASFSENVGIVGNQIKINDYNAKQIRIAGANGDNSTIENTFTKPKLDESSMSINNISQFTFKFSEKELKE